LYHFNLEESLRKAFESKKNDFEEDRRLVTVESFEPNKDVFSYWFYQELFRVITFKRSVLEFCKILMSGYEALWDADDPVPYFIYHHFQMIYTLVEYFRTGDLWEEVNFCLGRVMYWSNCLGRVTYWSNCLRRVMYWSNCLWRVMDWSNCLGRVTYWSNCLRRVMDWSNWQFILFMYTLSICKYSKVISPYVNTCKFCCKVTILQIPCWNFVTDSYFDLLGVSFNLFIHWSYSNKYLFCGN